MEAIVCVNMNDGIGLKGRIPWKSFVYEDFIRTEIVGCGNNAIIMGHKTFKSLGYIPLPGVRNYILSRNINIYIKAKADVIVESNPDNLWFLMSIFENVYVLGGESTYSFFEPYIKTVHYFTVDRLGICDRHFPIDLSDFEEKNFQFFKERYNHLTYIEYEKKSL
jgi:dihydrofolate reductase